MDKLAQIEAKIASLTVEQVIDCLKSIVNDFRHGTDIVIERIMTNLETRMPESEFVALLESL